VPFCSHSTVHLLSPLLTTLLPQHIPQKTNTHQVVMLHSAVVPYCSHCNTAIGYASFQQYSPHPKHPNQRCAVVLYCTVLSYCTVRYPGITERAQTPHHALRNTPSSVERTDIPRLTTPHLSPAGALHQILTTACNSWLAPHDTSPHHHTSRNSQMQQSLPTNNGRRGHRCCCCWGMSYRPQSPAFINTSVQF
jgi:hypothetical protein